MKRFFLMLLAAICGPALVNAQTPAGVSIDFDDGSNPFSAGTVVTDFAHSGSQSLYLGNRQTATYSIPAAFDGQPVVVTMQVLDLGLWVDNEVEGYPTNAYGPRWAVGNAGTAANYVAATIIQKTFLPSTAGYALHEVDKGDDFSTTSWFSPTFYTGSTRVVLSDDGGSNPGSGWVPGTPAAEPVWTEWTFTVEPEGDLVLTFGELDPVTGNNIGGPATQILLYGGNDGSGSQNALTGLYIDSITITTPDFSGDTEAPSVPTGLTVSGIEDRSVDLDWDPSTDNTGVDAYWVYLDGSNPTEVSGTSITLTGLEPETTYTLTVSALDGAGNESAQSEGVQVTTEAPSTMRYGFGIVDGQYLNTGNFLNWLELTDSSWNYSYAMGSWLWMPVSFGSDLSLSDGSWAYVMGTPSEADDGEGLVYGYPVVNENIHAENFLGWTYVPQAPWVYLWGPRTWGLIDATTDANLKTKPQAWVFFRNAGSAYPKAVLEAQPVAYWRFSETTGEVARDHLNGLEATIVENADLTALGAGSAVGLTSSEDSYLEVADTEVLDLEGSFSIEFWIYPNFDSTLFTGIIGKGDDTFKIQRNVLGDQLRFEVKGGGETSYVNSQFELPTLQWTHVVAVHDADADELRLYFNGQPDPNTADHAGGVNTNDHGLQIGAHFTGSQYQRFFKGLLDEVAIYDTALSPQAIAANYSRAVIDPTGIPLRQTEITVDISSNTEASISWETNLGATARLRYGLSPDELTQVSDLLDNGETEHVFDISGLTPGTTYYYTIESMDVTGRMTTSPVLSFDAPGELTLLNLETVQVTPDSAVIRWETNNRASARVHYSTVESDLDEDGKAQRSDLVDEENLRHAIGIINLEPGTTYFGRVVSTDEFGIEESSETFSFSTLAEGEVLMTDELTQYGITWTLDQAYPAGRFINGDWWVVGPVTVVSVDPAPGVAPPDEENDFGPNQFGDFGLQFNNDHRNGSMIVLTPGNRQGFDSRGLQYRAETSLSFPYNLEANHSLLSSRSYKHMPNRRLFHAIMWDSEKNGSNPIRTVAVLTCLDAAPPADAFRPGYMGTNKEFFTESQLQWDQLQELFIDPAIIPSFDQYARYFQRVWVDHLNGSWTGQHLLPNENMASYGREIARLGSVATLMLHTQAPQEDKRELLINFVQYGIDLHTMVQLGAHYNEGGGHTSGRKWPIIFAGLMLGEPEFYDFPETAIFHEDTQTYYGEGYAGQTALWQMVIHHGVRKTYMELHPREYDTYDGGWAKTSEGYRTCCTIRAWVGQALGALLMEAKSIWNHDAYFDNVEDWMRLEDIYAENRDGATRNSWETTTFSTFETEMWRIHRDSVPDQPGGTVFRKWIPSGGGKSGTWVDNPKPES